MSGPIEFWEIYETLLYIWMAIISHFFLKLFHCDHKKFLSRKKKSMKLILTENDIFNTQTTSECSLFYKIRNTKKLY